MKKFYAAVFTLQVISLWFASLLFLGEEIFSQGIGINTTGNLANASAGVDIDFTNKGLLIPRVTNAQRTAMNPLPQAAQGLLVYQTDGEEGFYYNTSTTTTPNWLYLRAHGKQLFTSSGTFVVPAGVTTVWVSMCGGGGSGSSGDGAATAHGGGGGGAAAVLSQSVAVTPLASIAVTVGAGGAASAGGPPRQAGNAGGNSSFGAFITCNGGGGAGAGGGPGTSGGAGGAQGGYSPGAIAGSPCSGGGSIFGAGGVGPSFGAGGGAGYGAGGAGGYGGGNPGAAGSAGFVLVEW